MDTIAYTLALIAGAIHVYIFTLESIIWRRPRAYRTFGITSLNDVETLAPAMFNQGFYNLFLAFGAIGGSLLGFGGSSTGEVLTLYTMAFMLGAALVLLATDRKMMRGVLVQGLLPAISFVLLLVA